MIAILDQQNWKQMYRAIFKAIAKNIRNILSNYLINLNMGKISVWFWRS